MDLSKAECLKFHPHDDAEVLRKAAKGILIPTPAAMATTGDGWYALIHQFKARNAGCKLNAECGCRTFDTKPDLIKGKFESRIHTSVWHAFKEELKEEGRCDLDQLEGDVSCAFLGWVIVKGKKMRHGEYKGLSKKLWLPYLLVLPDRACLEAGSHGVAKIEWRRDPERAFRPDSDKRKAVTQIMKYLRRERQSSAA